MSWSYFSIISSSCPDFGSCRGSGGSVLHRRRPPIYAPIPPWGQLLMARRTFLPQVNTFRFSHGKTLLDKTCFFGRLSRQTSANLTWGAVHLTHFYVWLMSTTHFFHQWLRGGPGGGVFLWMTVDLYIQRVFCNRGCLIGFWTSLLFRERFSTAIVSQSHNDIVNICDNEVMIFGLESAQKLCAKCSRLISFPPLTDLEPLSFIVCRKVHYIEYRFFSKVIYQGKSCF